MCPDRRSARGCPNHGDACQSGGRSFATAMSLSCDYSEKEVQKAEHDQLRFLSDKLTRRLESRSKHTSRRATSQLRAETRRTFETRLISSLLSWWTSMRPRSFPGTAWEDVNEPTGFEGVAAHATVVVLPQGSSARSTKEKKTERRTSSPQGRSCSARPSAPLFSRSEREHV